MVSPNHMQIPFQTTTLPTPANASIPLSSIRSYLNPPTLHDGAAAVLLLGRLVKHLALRTQSVGLCNKSIYLLATLQYGFDSLVQNNLGLVELLLDLQCNVLAICQYFLI